MLVIAITNTHNHCHKKDPLARMLAIPEIFSINHINGHQSSIEVVKQPRVGTGAARSFVPAAIRLESRAVAKGVAAICEAEMMRNQFGLPGVNRIARAGACEMKFFRFVIPPPRFEQNEQVQRVKVAGMAPLIRKIICPHWQLPEIMKFASQFLGQVR